MVARHIPAGEGAIGFGPGGDRYVTKLTSADTRGSFNLTEIVIPPNSGPPLHKHTQEDELFILLEGSLAFWLDGRSIVASVGDVVLAPRNAPHTFKNCSSNQARAMVLIAPPVSEQFFRGFTEPRTDGNRATDAEIIERMMRLAPQYGIEILGPSPL